MEAPDVIVELMKREGIPLTLENYLIIAYPDQEPDLDAELLSMIPDEVKR